MHFVEAKGILSSQNGINIYRGCTHGCIYCDSRSDCYQFSHPFEDVEVKINAPQLLERALRSKRKKCMIGTGAMGDPYEHAEKKLEITKKCLEIISRYGFGFAALTKSSLVMRDIDLFEKINDEAKSVLQMTLTTYDEDLVRTIEPHVATTKERFETLSAFGKRGIPLIVWTDPVLPFINDTEENVRGILGYCLEAGVKGIISFGMGLTLRDGDREYFYGKLDEHFPGLKEKYMKTYGLSYELPSPNAARLRRIMEETCDKYGIMHTPQECFAYLNEFPEKYEQLSFF